MARSTFVYVTYIRTTPARLWSALTDAEFMRQYWFGMRCESSDDLEGAMVEALATDGPVLMDVRVAAEENCYPMIPPGSAARDMVEAPRGAVR